MCKVSLILCMFYYKFSLINAQYDQCFNNRNENSCNEVRSEVNLYTKDSNEKHLKYVNSIESAAGSYESCPFTNCSCYNFVIFKDLDLFKQNGISENMINLVRIKGTKYQIIDGRLYREKDCLFPSRCKGIEYFLLKFVHKMPDMDLIINTRDWPQIFTNSRDLGPVFSFSKTYDYADIMYPAWSFWEGGPAISLYPTGLGRWDSHRKTVSKAGESYPWASKIQKGFFRGSRTSSERDPLVVLSRENPDLVDAQYTKNQAWKSEADTLYAVPAPEVTLEDHCKYKYLFNFRGVAASFRFKHLFLCKSLVFHVGEEWKEFFYPILKPWVHYIPVDPKARKEDIQSLIEFAKNNDELVKNIAENGFKTIWNHLRMEDVNCYWKKLLKRYAKLLKYQPKLDQNLIEIKSN